MRTITKIFIWGLLLIPMCAFAQKATNKEEFDIRIEWEDMRGYSEWASYKVPVYYDKKGNAIKHGPFRINQQSNLSGRVGQKCIISYTATGNYVNGKLSGALSVEKTYSLQPGVLKFKGKASFVKGVPTGTWRFSRSGSYYGNTELKTVSVTINNHKYIKYNDGVHDFQLFQINKDNTFSGKTNGEVYKKSINTSKFINKKGETTNLDKYTQNIINAYIAGTISDSDLITKGFIKFENYDLINSIDFDNLMYYFWLADFEFELNCSTTTIPQQPILQLSLKLLLFFSSIYHSFFLF